MRAVAAAPEAWRDRLSRGDAVDVRSSLGGA